MVATPAPLVIVAGAPRVPVDAIRYLHVAVSGRTGALVAAQAQAAGIPVQAIVAADVAAAAQAVLPAAAVQTWVTRPELEAALQATLSQEPAATLFLSAAINDYDVAGLSWVDAGGISHRAPAGTGKLPSGATDVRLELQPARKLIADLPGWGHRGRLIACKYSPAATVLAQAQALQAQHQADLVLANSLDGSVQALVGADGRTQVYPDRPAVLAALVAQLRLWNFGNDGVGSMT